MTDTDVNLGSLFLRGQPPAPTDAELIERLRAPAYDRDVLHRIAAAARIEALVAENDALKYDIERHIAIASAEAEARIAAEAHAKELTNDAIVHNTAMHNLHDECNRLRERAKVAERAMNDYLAKMQQLASDEDRAERGRETYKQEVSDFDFAGKLLACELKLDFANTERDALIDVLQRNGFVRCDIPACNCGSWHARYGLRERFDEIVSDLADAGHPLTNENGNLLRRAVGELIAERDALRQLLIRWRDTYGGSTMGRRNKPVDAILDAETDAAFDAARKGKP